MGWIGFDLDGTLAEYHMYGDGTIGAPIAPMIQRCKEVIESGVEARIFTARVAVCDLNTPTIVEAQRKIITDWCIKYIGQALEITCQKDYHMITCYDDRTERVETNTGRLL